jgi:hypothetical protein
MGADFLRQPDPAGFRSFFESLRPGMGRAGIQDDRRRIDGPARGPRPASSTPQISGGFRHRRAGEEGSQRLGDETRRVPLQAGALDLELIDLGQTRVLVRQQLFQGLGQGHGGSLILDDLRHDAAIGQDVGQPDPGQQAPCVS